MLGTTRKLQRLAKLSLLLILGGMSGCFYVDDGSYPQQTPSCSSCGGAAPAGPVAPELLYLTISPANLVVWPGDEVQFVVTGEYSNGATVDLTSEARWYSSDSWVAGVSNQYGYAGYATAYDDGPTTITASLPEGDVSTDLYVDSSAPFTRKDVPHTSAKISVKHTAPTASEI